MGRIMKEFKDLKPDRNNNITADSIANYVNKNKIQIDALLSYQDVLSLVGKQLKKKDHVDIGSTEYLLKTAFEWKKNIDYE